MIQAFKKQQPDYDKFDEYLSDVPNKYREKELRCDSLSQEIPKGCMLICIVSLRVAITNKFMACNC